MLLWSLGIWKMKETFLVHKRLAFSRKERSRKERSTQKHCKRILSPTAEGTGYKREYGTSLVAQWLGIHLPIQRTWVRFLVQEDSMCLEQIRAHMSQLLKPTHLEHVPHNKRSPQSEKPVHHNEESPRSLQLKKA